MPNNSPIPDGEGAVVIYESPEARQHLLQLMNQHKELARNAAGEWVLLGSLRAADDSRWFRRSLNAECIIIAASCRGDFDDEFKRWLDRLASKRAGKEGTLIGLFHDRCAWDVASLKELHLPQVARTAGLDYLCRIPANATSVPDSIDTFSERAGQRTSVLDSILSTRTSVARPS